MPRSPGRAGRTRGAAESEIAVARALRVKSVLGAERAAPAVP